MKQEFFLTNRQLDYLEILLEQTDYISSEELSGHVKYSGRTVKMDMKELRQALKKFNVCLESKSGMGYRLKLENHKDYTFLKNVIQKERKQMMAAPYDTAKKRRQAILKQLLFCEKRITLEKLSEELFISINAIRQDMRYLESLLGKFGIGLCTAPYKGYYIIGTEMARRNCICLFLNKESIAQKLQMDLQDLQRKRLVLKTRISEEAEKFQIELTDNAIGFLADYLSLDFIDNEKNEQPETEMRRGTEYSLADKICKIADDVFEGKKGEHKTEVVAGVICCKKKYEAYEIPKEMYDIALQMLDKINDKFQIKLKNWGRMLEMLAGHLMGLFWREKLKLYEDMPTLKDIFCQQAIAVDVVNEAIKALPYKNLNEQEVGALALLFSIEVEDYASKKKILFVNDRTWAENEFFVNHIRTAFGGLVDSIDVCSRSQIKQMKFTGNEIVVSTTTVEEAAPYVRQVRMCQNMFSNIMNLYQAITEIPQGSFNIDEIIDENWVLELEGVKERSMYYEHLFNHLCDSCTLDLEEARKLYKSIELYGQEIENGICLIRGKNSFVQPFIHFTFLKQPIKWKTELVSVIIFINFSNEDFVYRSNVYRHLNYLISNVENVKKVKANPKFSLIYKMLHMNWVYDRIDLANDGQLPAFENWE